jgi:hypothetical protein
MSEAVLDGDPDGLTIAGHSAATGPSRAAPSGTVLVQTSQRQAGTLAAATAAGLGAPSRAPTTVMITRPDLGATRAARVLPVPRNGEPLRFARSR